MNGRECFSRTCRAFFSIGWNTLRVLAGSSRSLVLNEVITAKGQVHGKTLNAIRDRIDRFHAMNVFGDADAATKLTQLKQQIAGLSGQDLAQQPDVAEKLSRACQTLKNEILNPDVVSQLTGRLKRRVVLD